jgi:serine/threonine protein phosphatase PrpC
MEDADLMYRHSDWECIAVFDGHGGREVADRLGQEFGLAIGTALQQVDPSDSKAVTAAIDAACVALDATFMELNDGSGSCMVSAWKHGPYLYITHLGDSRALLFTDSGTLLFATEDHSLQQTEERARVEACACTPSHSIWGNRVANGTRALAVARAFGDRAFKPCVSNRVSTYAHVLGDETLSLVLACDGLFENAEHNQTVVDQAADLHRSGAVDVAKQLVCTALHTRQSQDNISVVFTRICKAPMLASTACVMHECVSM